MAGSLQPWGWVLVCVGLAEWWVGATVFLESRFSRLVGVVVLALNAIAQLLFIRAYPFWSLAIFGVNVVAIYGLLAYGNRISSAD